MTSILQAISDIHRQLTGRYPKSEIESFIRILFGHYLGMSSAQIHLSPDMVISSDDETRLKMAVDDLTKFRPIQYIIGKSEFYGLTFKVSPDVLIPRPETEELVDWIVRENNHRSGMKILDIGAGSGCIAISLATSLPNTVVWAIDNSDAALAVASENAKINGVTVNYMIADMLSDAIIDFFPEAFFDMIVSNPPYIALSEKQLMHPNVLEYEPHSALFPQGNDPLVFYRKIANVASRWLKKDGRLFFEINEAFPEEVSIILAQTGYSDITRQKDINDKWRMISAKFV